MSELYEYVLLSVVLGWLFSRLAGLFAAPRSAALAGGALGGLAMLGQYAAPEMAGFSALFSPVSLGIALLAGADLARPFGLCARRWPALELAALLALYVAYVYASVGEAAPDPYALGYAGVGPAAVAMALAGWAFWRRDALLALTVAGAQLSWLLGLGSENFFDHLASALLVPAALIGLARRLRRV